MARFPTLQLLQQKEKLWIELSDLWYVNELAIKDRMVVNPETNEKWMPDCWKKAMEQSLDLYAMVQPFKSIPTEDLAPMTPRMAQLCIELKLPGWKIAERETTPQPEWPRHKSRIRQRCGYCGSWAYPKNGTGVAPTTWVCEGCGGSVDTELISETHSLDNNP